MTQQAEKASRSTTTSNLNDAEEIRDPGISCSNALSPPKTSYYALGFMFLGNQLVSLILLLLRRITFICSNSV